MSAYIRMFRLEDWFLFYLPVPVAAAYLAGGSAAQLALVAFVFFCVIAYGYVANNYYDVDIDRTHSGKIRTMKNPLALERVSRRGTLVVMVVLVCLSMAAALLSKPVGVVFVLLTLAAFAAYDTPLGRRKVKLKDVPYVDFVTHGLQFGLLPFVAGVTMCDGTLGPRIISIGVIVTYQAMLALLIHQMVDYEEDEASAGTTVVRMGLERSWRIFQTGFAGNAVLLAMAVLVFRLHPVLYLPVLLHAVLYGRFRGFAYAARPKRRKRILIAFQSVMAGGLVAVAFSMILGSP
jgi:4-hydroxybenzoate polyprenyltransferase